MRKLRCVALALAAAGLSLVGINPDPVGAVNDDYGEIYYIGYQPGGSVRPCDWYQGGDGWFPTHNQSNWNSWAALNCTVDFSQGGFHIRVDAHGGSGQVAAAVMDIWVGGECQGVQIRESGSYGYNNWGLVFTEDAPNAGSCLIHGLHTYNWTNTLYQPSAPGRYNLMWGEFDGNGNPAFCDSFGTPGSGGWIDHAMWGTSIPGQNNPVSNLWLRVNANGFQEAPSSPCNNNGWKSHIVLNPTYHF